MKSKKKWLGMGALILIVLCMSAAFMATQGKTNYYTQIDNRWVKEIAPHGAMNYKSLSESGTDSRRSIMGGNTVWGNAGGSTSRIFKAVI